MHLLLRVLLPLSLSLLLTMASPLPACAEPARTPRQLIDRLGLEFRQLLNEPKPARAPEAAEQAVADQLAALIRSAPGHPSLTQPDPQGRTPLLLAVSGGYLSVVKALLADATVKAGINHANTAGETAWMLAQFAPAMTLVACQPGALTLDRYPLLPPYLRRMALMMKPQKSPMLSIAQALEAAGATADREGAQRAWLARCPNTTVELRAALAQGNLLSTLSQSALDRQMAFNKAYREGLVSLPQKPPEGMKFVPAHEPRVSVKALDCARMEAPALRGALNWSGRLTFKADIATRAGIVEAVDFQVIADATPEPHVVNHFRAAIVRALAGYACEGDHVFQQEFHFKVE